MNDMYIDIGAESREDALKYVNYGDSINFEGDFKINGKTVVTKALDDRFGCYVLINLIKSNPNMICISHLLFRKKWDCVVQDLRLYG